MKNKTLSFLLALLMSMVASVASAHDFEVDGIYYNITSSTDLTALVTYRGIYKDSYSNEYTGSVTIPESVTYSGKTYSVTSIGAYTFWGCSGLTSIEIPNSVTSIGYDAFSGTAWYSNQPDGIVYAGKVAYEYKGTMPEGTEIVLEEGTLGIAGSAFSLCTGLTSVTIPESVTSIGTNAFWGCSGLTSIEIPNSVTSIGDYAFRGCSGLTSIEIPNSVTSIGDYAFSYCTGITELTIADGEGTLELGYNSYSSGTSGTGKGLFYDCPLEKLYLGRNISYQNGKSYGYSPFYGKNKLASVNIGNSVKSIGDRAFSGCSGLTSLTIGNSVTRIGDCAFSGCTGLTSIEIPNSVTSIGWIAFDGCWGLTSVSLECPTVGTWFSGLKGIQQLSIGKNVETIKASAFSGCTNMTEAVMGDNVKSVGANAFPTSTTLNVNRGTTSLLALWNANYLAPTEKGTENVLTASTLNLEGTTQMTATVSVNDFYPEYENTLNDNVIDEAVNVFTTQPELESTVTLRVTKDAVTYTAPNLTYTTLPISPTATRAEGTASSMAVKASCLEGDAEVTSQTLTVNGVTVEGDSLYLNGLKPGTTYEAAYTIKVNDEYEYTGTVNLQTDALNFVNEQPKVITEGNIIVASQSNLDDAEENVGFQWRRNDWTDDFESKSAGAYIYEGMIEGYIRSLNSNYLWKFRPYYQSADGTYYYGSWSGMDPADFSYFEPTVHTYANITVEGNSAEVKGYAQRGTDNVVSQGFMYWTSSPQPSPVGREKAPAIPSGAQKVEATGTVMEASLTGLEYETTYSYVAYVTTSEGETFYGEEKMFTTGENPDGIEAIDNGQLTMNNAKGVYDLSGRKMNVNDNVNVNNSKFEIQNSKLRKGIYIVNGKKLLKR